VAYTEEQVRRWLAFLARNMQSHGQSVFLVEQLQPNWLANEQQTSFYLLISRTFMYGVVGGLSTFLFLLWWCNSWDDRVSTLKPCSEVAGAIVLLIALFIFLRTSERLPGWIRLLAGAISIPFVFAFGWIISRPVQWVVRRYGRTLNDDIQPVERLSWQWAGFWRGLIFLSAPNSGPGSVARWNRATGMAFWVVRGAALALMAGAMVVIWVYGHSDMYGEIMAALAVAAFWPSLICGVFGAVQPRFVELKATPNLGIKLSGRNAFMIGIIASVLFGVSLACFVLSDTKSSPNLATLEIGFILLLGLPAYLLGPSAMLRLGGMDFVAHYCLRLLLWVYGYAPLNYVRFLDYAATELGFLQKVGGGYVFMHRYLLEYFASSEEAPAAAPDRLQPV
jgi:hypothetical protein